jgi:hypothetical protein
VLFADGQLADLPIATCEIQGYAYDARACAGTDSMTRRAP